MKSGWIWIPNQTNIQTKETFVYFSKSIELKEVPKMYQIKISADSRYKLYINGKMCEVGPSKGDDTIWFYDVIDIAVYLKKGENLISVIVLHYPVDKDKGNQSVFRTKTPGLYLEGPTIITDSTWKAKEVSNITIVSENPFFAPLQIYEEAKGAKEDQGWMIDSEVSMKWEQVVEYEESDLSKQLLKKNLKERTIPFMRRVARSFKEGMADERVIIPPFTRESFDLDAGELMTGYLCLSFLGGADAVVRILQSEGYVEEAPVTPKSYDDLPIKGNRSDSIQGVLVGYSDNYEVIGFGKEKEPEVYEPFWFRTFRYIRISITTKAEPLLLQAVNYIETGYPLNVVTKAKVSEPVFDGIWEISERTLRRCMHETYEDCPFYEQLQYVMDSRSQMLYTYAISADDRLARKCMDDFKRSQNKEGLLNGSYPNLGENIIPGFSIYFIGMLHDHMMYFGDKELILEHLPTIDRILEYFSEHLNKEGVVEKIGGLNQPNSRWSFIDWTPEWNQTNGVPSATLEGPIAMESLLYLYGLQMAAAIYGYLGNLSMENKYKSQSEILKRAIRTCYLGDNGLFKDGPSSTLYSQHSQVFAVLTDTVTKEEGRRILMETLAHKERYAQCSVAMMFYLFRALEKCDLYEKTYDLWNIWREMLENNLTTCAEDSLKSRSDCHAWGALVLYELPAVVFGIRPASPGFKTIRFTPHCEMFEWATGSMITPHGIVEVSWEKQEGNTDIKYSVPKEIKVIKDF